MTPGHSATRGEAHRTGWTPDGHELVFQKPNQKAMDSRKKLWGIRAEGAAFAVFVLIESGAFTSSLRDRFTAAGPFCQPLCFHSVLVESPKIPLGLDLYMPVPESNPLERPDPQNQ